MRAHLAHRGRSLGARHSTYRREVLPALRRVSGWAFGLAARGRASTQRESTANGLDFLIDVIGVCCRPSILLNSYPDATDYLEVKLQSLKSPDYSHKFPHRSSRTEFDRRFAPEARNPKKLTFKNFLNLSACNLCGVGRGEKSS